MRDDITLKVKNAGEITAEYQVIGDPRNAVERRARVYVERLDFHAHGRQHQGRSRTGTVVQAAGSCPWEADTPAGVWAGSDQRSRHAVGCRPFRVAYSLSRSANCYSVRDRGGRGSNPLAPTTSLIFRNVERWLILVTCGSGPEGRGSRRRRLLSIGDRQDLSVLVYNARLAAAAITRRVACTPMIVLDSKANKGESFSWCSTPGG